MRGRAVTLRQVLDSGYSLARFQHGSNQRFATAVDTLCFTCAQQAPDAAAQHHLTAACSTLQAAAVALTPPDEL